MTEKNDSLASDAANTSDAAATPTPTGRMPLPTPGAATPAPTKPARRPLNADPEDEEESVGLAAGVAAPGSRRNFTPPAEVASPITAAPETPAASITPPVVEKTARVPAPAPGMPLPSRSRGGATPTPGVIPRAVSPNLTQPMAAQPAPGVVASTDPNTLPPVAVAASGAAAVNPLDAFGSPVAEEVGLAGGHSAPERLQTNATTFAGGNAPPETQPSKYYAGQAVDPKLGIQYDAATGQPTNTATPPGPAKKPEDVVLNWDEPGANRIGGPAVYLGVFAAILVAAAIAAHFLPTAVVVPLLIANFLGGLLLPILRVAPWQDDDGDDAVLVFVLMIVFGPAIGLVIYGFKAALTQDFNMAALGCLAVATTSRLVVGAAAGGMTVKQLTPLWSQLSPFSASVLIINLAGLLAIVGWFMANIFHKLDE